MPPKPRISIVGAGNLGTALALSLRQAGFRIDEIVTRAARVPPKRTHALAREVSARAVTIRQAQLKAEVIWFCVPDIEIAKAARSLAKHRDWKGKVALHSSGALTSDELDVLRQQGASVASVHPLMTFVRRSRPSLAGVPFAIEGDLIALRMARRLVKDLGGKAHTIRKQDKPAYHAWGTFASPLLTALLATTERVAGAAGATHAAARQRMLPIILQTISNYAALGAAGAFSGPIVRGDIETVRQHLTVLREIPLAREVYLALARAALHDLSSRNKKALQNLLAQG